MKTPLFFAAAFAGLIAGTPLASAQSTTGQSPGQRAEQPNGPDSGRLQPGMREPGSPRAGESAYGQAPRNENTRANTRGGNSPGVAPGQTPGQRSEQPEGPDSGHTPPSAPGNR